MTTPETIKPLGSRNVRLDLDSLTRARYERARANYSVVVDAESTIQAVAGESGAYLARDLFGGVYAPHTSVDEETEQQPIRKLLDWAVTELERLPDWRALVNQAAGNVIGSALATEVVTNHLSTLTWPALESEKQDPNVLTRDNAGSPESISVWRDGVTVHVMKTVNGKPTTSSRSFGSIEAANRMVEQHQRQARANGFVSQQTSPTGTYDEALQAFVDAVTQDATSGPLMRGAAGPLVRAAIESLDAAEQALCITYGLEDAELQLGNPDPNALKIAQAASKDKRLRDFMKHIGRFLDAMKTSPVRQRVRGNIMPYDVSNTRDFRRLVPSELAMLALPATRAQQTVRVVSGQALGWQMADMGAKSRGPIHVTLDISGSMNERQTEAKAFAVAACLHAADNNRPVSASVFNTGVMAVANGLENSTKRAEFVQKLLSINCYGGTNFTPMVQHVANIGAMDDVMLISDGVGGLDVELAEKVFATRALHYLVIGSESDVHPTLRKLSAGRTMLASDLSGSSVSDFAASASAVR